MSPTTLEVMTMLPPSGTCGVVVLEHVERAEDVDRERCE